MDPIHNERVKLTATALNNTAIATIVTGLIAPAASYGYGFANLPPGPFWWIIGAAWLVGGVTLHVAGRVVLGRLRL